MSNLYSFKFLIVTGFELSFFNLLVLDINRLWFQFHQIGWG